MSIAHATSAPDTLPTNAERTPGGALLARARDYLDAEIAPHVLRIDSEGVDISVIERFRALGLLNVGAERFGGIAATAEEQRDLHEAVAHASLNVWLVWAQHAGAVVRVVNWLGDREPPHPLVDDLVHGRVLSGAALSDVRHYPEQYIRAQRTDGGYRLTGTISWVSGWGLNQVLLTAAIDPQTDEVVRLLVPTADATSAEPLDLAAVAGSHTWRVRLEDVLVPDALVFDVQPLQAWTPVDHEGAIDVKTHLFGLGRAITDALQASSQDAARRVGDLAARRLSELRVLAEALADSDDPVSQTAERLQVRAEASDALARAARALLVSRSGRGIASDDIAQLYAREALFLQVQAQTDSVRAAQLDLIAQGFTA